MFRLDILNYPSRNMQSSQTCLNVSFTLSLLLSLSLPHRNRSELRKFEFGVGQNVTYNISSQRTNERTNEGLTDWRDIKTLHAVCWKRTFCFHISLGWSQCHTLPDKSKIGVAKVVVVVRYNLHSALHKFFLSRWIWSFEVKSVKRDFDRYAHLTAHTLPVTPCRWGRVNLICTFSLNLSNVSKNIFFSTFSFSFFFRLKVKTDIKKALLPNLARWLKKEFCKKCFVCSLKFAPFLNISSVYFKCVCVFRNVKFSNIEKLRLKVVLLLLLNIKN